MATRRKPVVWTASAIRSLDDVLAYVANDSIQAAQNLAKEILAKGESLATLSERGRIVPEFQDPAIREMLIYSYRLMYLVGDDQVVILAFIHGARDFERWRRQS